MNIQHFFKTYQQANQNFDVEIIASCYADTFLFGQPQGTQTIKKEDFIRMLPSRKGFIQKIGQQSSMIVSLEESVLNEKYRLVKTTWKVQYKKERKLIEDFIHATYILYLKNNTFQIVAQIDHQDLIERVKELGLI